MTVLTRTLAFLLVLLSLQSFAAPKRFKVKIIVPYAINNHPHDFSVSYDNGKTYQTVKTNFKNLQAEISGEYYGRYATILIGYREFGAYRFSISRSWVTEEPATIRITDDWAHPVLTHAIDVSKAGDSAFHAFIAPAEEARDNYWNEHEKAILKLDSPERQVFFEKMKAVDNRRLDFLQQVKDTYYGLWCFRTALMGMGSSVPYGYPGVTPAQLRQLLETTIPKKKEYAFERGVILDWLAAREVRPGAQAPVFTAMDTRDHKVSLADFKGKYVLLNFWASWCEPCVAELPAIKKMYDRYSGDQLVVVGVSADKDTAAFQRAVEKYQINWTKLKWDETFTDKYGVAALPRLFLIDPTGKIVYEREQELPETIDSLPLLQGILEEKLTKK